MTSPLRQVLAEIRAGRATSLGEIADRVGVSRDEASAMVDHWVRKGRLTRNDLGDACGGGGCGSCSSGRDGAPGCGAGPGAGAGAPQRPVLLAIGMGPPDGGDRV